MRTLPPEISPADLDRLRDEPDRWLPAVAAIARDLAPGAAVAPAGGGTSLVALVGDDLVLKVCPPRLHESAAFERAVLERLEGRLSVATPRVVAAGERDGWAYLLATRLRGTPLEDAWSGAGEPARRGLLRAIGALIAEVHAIAPGPLADLPPAWALLLDAQRAGAPGRHARTGLPAHLLAGLDAYLDAGDVFAWARAAPRVILTGEYTPENLLVRAGGGGGLALAGMFDFGDGLVGPAEYDLLGPSCFLGGGDPDRIAALFDGAGRPAPDARARGRLMRLLLPHRFSYLRAQVRIDGWERARDLDALAAIIWPS